MTGGSKAFRALALTVGALVFQVAFPSLAWLPIIAFLIFVALGTKGHLGNIRLGIIGGLLLVFLATGLVAAAIAFDPGEAWNRFWALSGAVMLYFVIARQPASNTAVITGMAALVAGALSILLIANAGQASPGLDFPTLSNWLGSTPLQNSGAPAIAPNQAGGIVALLFPLGVLDLVLSRWRKRGRGAWFSAALLAVAALGLLASSSRGAWAALALGAGVGLAAWFLRHVLKLNSRVLLAGPLLAGVGLAIGLWGVLYLTPGLPGRVDTLLPGLPDAASRINLAKQAVWIAQDFPWTGVGLGAFGGIYSRYMLLIPQFYFGYAHNMFLDVWVAQGPLALLCLGTVLATAAWQCSKFMAKNTSSQTSLLGATVMAGLAILAGHGMVDSPAYAGSGIAVLFLYPALATSLVGGSLPQANTPDRHEKTSSHVALKIVAAIGLAVLALLAVDFRDTLRSGWLSNVNSLRMARVELAGWPDQEILLNRTFEQDKGMAEGFATALALDPRNRAASYRLGLLAMRHNDFQAATTNLRKALSLAPQHRGIMKALGYAYAWDGKPETAARTLREIPEARYELELYSEWWLEQGNAVMSQRSKDVLNAMAN